MCNELLLLVICKSNLIYCNMLLITRNLSVFITEYNASI